VFLLLLVSAFGNVIISNSTLSNNTASSSGGGIISGGVTTISNTTFSNNSASSGGGIRFMGETEGAAFALVNSIVSGSLVSRDNGSKQGLEVHVSGIDDFRSELIVRQKTREVNRVYLMMIFAISVLLKASLKVSLRFEKLAFDERAVSFRYTVLNGVTLTFKFLIFSIFLAFKFLSL